MLQEELQVAEGQQEPEERLPELAAVAARVLHLLVLGVVVDDLHGVLLGEIFDLLVGRSPAWRRRRVAVDGPLGLRRFEVELLLDEVDVAALRGRPDGRRLPVEVVVARGLERGELRGGDADTVSLSCWSMVHGFSMLCIDQALPQLVDRNATLKVAAEMLRLLRLGLSTL